MKFNRTTKQKKLIDDICLNSKRALTISEIHQEAKKHIGSINLATIYRNLNQLIENNKLSKFKHAKKGTLYEIPHKSPHHYFFCSECNETFERSGCGLSTCIEDMKKNPNDGFIITSHELYFHGICATCAS